MIFVPEQLEESNADPLKTRPKQRRDIEKKNSTTRKGYNI